MLVANSELSPCPVLPDLREHSPSELYDLNSSRASLYMDMHVILISRSGINKDAYEEILMKCGAYLSKCYDDTGIIDLKLIRDAVAGNDGRNAVYFYINQPVSGLTDRREMHFLYRELESLKLRWFLSECMITSVLNNSPPKLLNDPMEIMNDFLNTQDFPATIEGHRPPQKSPNHLCTKEVRNFSGLPTCDIVFTTYQHTILRDISQLFCLSLSLKIKLMCLVVNN